MNTSKYTCVIKTADITSPHTKITSVVGAHESGKCNDDVEAILFDDTVVTFFPRGLHEIFPKLKTFEINRCGLSAISAEDLAGHEELLEVLDLGGNNLFTVPTDLLRNMRNLRCVSFDHNQLKYVSSKLLDWDYSHKLEYVGFKKNTFDAYFYHKPSIGGIKSLNRLMEIIGEKCSPPLEDTWRYESPSFKRELNEKWQQLWLTGYLSDYVIECVKKKFHVHKIVLASQSSEFMRIFENKGRKCVANRYPITGFDAEVVEEFLQFLYLGKLAKDTQVLQLFKLAVKFNVQALKELTEEILLTRISESSIAALSDIVHMFDSQASRLLDSIEKAL